jgi:hypothetical protein
MATSTQGGWMVLVPTPTELVVTSYNCLRRDDGLKESKAIGGVIRTSEVRVSALASAKIVFTYSTYPHFSRTYIFLRCFFLLFTFPQLIPYLFLTYNT